MSEEYTFTAKLSSPLTEEDWDYLQDVDMEHTNAVYFKTKHGKEVWFYKVVRCKDCKWYEHCNLPFTGDEFCSDGERKEEQ